MSWFGFGKKKTKTPEPENRDAAPAQTPPEPDPAPVQEPPAPDPEPAPPPAPETDPEPVEEPDPAPPEPAETKAPDPKAELEPGPEPAVPSAASSAAQPDARPGLFAKLAQGLSKSSARLTGSMGGVFARRRLDDDALEEIEEALIAADLGAPTAARVAAKLAKDRFDKDVSEAEIKQAVAEVVADTLRPYARPLDLSGPAPRVVLFVGVNGSGKTTTLGKIAVKMVRDGGKVITAAGDTFRAAAVEQLQVWSERAGAAFLSRPIGSDAAGLAYDAVAQGRAEGADAVLIDTAGRLQNKTELMDELKKIIRVVKKLDDTAPHHVVLVLDGTVGSNALSQAEAFLEASNITAVIMTKLDGTAKGGALVQVAEKFKLPIPYVGVGEGEEDLQDFDADAFGRALAGVEGRAA